MTFLFGDYRLTKGKVTKTITATASLACFFGNHGEAQADLTMAIDGRPNTVLIPGLDCSPYGPVSINFANFRLFFNRQALGYFWLVFRYHFRWKYEENLATLVPYVHVAEASRFYKFLRSQLARLFCSFASH